MVEKNAKNYLSVRQIHDKLHSELMKNMEARLDKNPFSIIHRYKNAITGAHEETEPRKIRDSIIRTDSIHNRYTFKLPINSPKVEADPGVKNSSRSMSINLN